MFGTDHEVFMNFESAIELLDTILIQEPTKMLWTRGFDPSLRETLSSIASMWQSPIPELLGPATKLGDAPPELGASGAFWFGAR
jgi:hypothetical protein